MSSSETVSRGPWIDVHGHGGRCFLAGFDESQPLVRLLGAPATGATLAAMRAGGLTAASFATVGDLAVLGFDPAGGLVAARDFAPGEARADHDRQLDGLTTLLAAQERVVTALTAADVEEAHRDGGVAAIMCCEGADFCAHSEETVADAYARGVRSIGLVHYRVNELGDVQTEAPVHHGVSDFGRRVVAEMNRLGMLVDLAHASFETTCAALECSRDPVMISHSHLAPAGAEHPRLLRPEHARAVAEAGGVVGAWPAGIVLRDLDDFAAEIARMADTIGVAHVAIGTDLDANYRPVLDRYEQFPELDAALARRGLDVTERDAILGGNFLALFRAVCG